MKPDRLPARPKAAEAVPSARPSRVARVRNQVPTLPSITSHLAQAIAHSIDRASELLPVTRKHRKREAVEVATPPANDDALTVVTFATLSTKLASFLSEADLARVREAYRFSDEAHLGQFRASGEPYISHPLAVAEICAEWHLDTQALMAALLHDVIEDQGIGKQELVERFGSPVAELVDGLSKLDKLEFESVEDAQAENFRKMLLAMSRDVRVILVKLADRLHNMRTLDAVEPNKRRRIARETLDIYAPIAHRLGLNQLYRELQDLCFANMHPMRYAVLRRAVLAARGNRREVVGKILDTVKTSLPQSGIEAEVFGREKTIYGIYRKMQEKNLSFSQVLDIYGFRVVVRDLAQCYLALGGLHGLYKPVPGKFKDYIAIPKLNGYQSLHTTLIGPFGTPVEFQIRTQDMHRIAESGVAAHWLYKADDASLNELQKRTHTWMQSLIEMQQQAGDATEFLEHVKIDLFPDAVYVFTPKSRIVSLPRGATPVDFAYQIHTDIGNRAIGARVNGTTVPLRSALKNGDIIEINTAPLAKPNPNWLSFVRTAKARAEIRHALRTSSLPESIGLGEQLFRQALAGLGVTWTALDASVWTRLLHETGTHDRDELLADIGLGRRIAAVVARRMLALMEGTPAHGEALAAGRAHAHSVLIHGTDGMAVQLAQCCCPIPGDGITGHLRKGSGLVIHTEECATARRLRAKDPDRWLDEVEWDDDDLKRSFDARVHLTVRNERGVLGRLAADIARSESNIAKVASQDEPESGHIELDLVLQVAGRVHLANVMRSLRKMPELVKIARAKG